MFPERGITLSFEPKEPRWKGLIEGGWIEVPAKPEMELPKPVYIYLAWWKRAWWIVCALMKWKIEINLWPYVVATPEFGWKTSNKKGANNGQCD